ncbi:MAG: S-layer homology domain-containing protein [Oscillibacter sp.]|nr:S-layer homology domain-containing protein [Oscillibacter sp.]
MLDSPPASDSADDPAPASPDDTGVSGWLLTDAHPSYINGFTDGTFRPNASITRAQTAMMFYRLLKNKNVPQNMTFRDMSGKEWYAEAVFTLAYYGIIQGYSDGNFHGDRTITRAAFTAICARFAKHIGEYKDGALSFSDVPETRWARDVIMGASSCGWIGGYDDGTFRPANSITRAAATAIMNRMLARVADREYVKNHFDSLKSFSDVRDETAWYFYNVMEAANNHDFSVKGSQEVWESVKN